MKVSLISLIWTATRSDEERSCPVESIRQGRYSKVPNPGSQEKRRTTNRIEAKRAYAPKSNLTDSMLSWKQLDGANGDVVMAVKAFEFRDCTLFPQSYMYLGEVSVAIFVHSHE